MREQAAEVVREALDRLYHAESRRILAILIRLLGDIDTAEDALQDAFAAAARQWPEQGIPANPRSWLISTGRFKAIDTMRRRSRFDSRLPAVQPDGDLAAVPAVRGGQLRSLRECRPAAAGLRAPWGRILPIYGDAPQPALSHPCGSER